MTLLVYRCRDNATHSLLAGDGRPRLAQYCPTCQALTLGLCCLLCDSETMRRMRTLNLAAVPVIRCARCHRVNLEPEFNNCPGCREDGRERLRRFKQ